MNTATKLTNEQMKNEPLKEGAVAKAIEKQTAKLPSDTFLWLAIGSMAVSAALQISGRKQESNFVGQWAPTFLVLGIYNKLVKLHGSDKQDTGEEEEMDSDFNDEEQQYTADNY